MRHSASIREMRLLSDAELRENGAEDFFYIYATRDLADVVQSLADIERHEFRGGPLGHGRLRRGERIGGTQEAGLVTGIDRDEMR